MFIGSEVKVSRAEKHIRELSDGIAEFLGRPGIRWIERPDGEKSGWTRVEALLAEPIPLELCGIASDAIQNLRSALDLAMADLARAAGITSNSKLAQIYFPMAQSALHLETTLAKMGFVIQQQTLTAVAAVEPYPGGRGEKLITLGRLSNSDKHRLLIPAMPGYAGRRLTTKLVGIKSTRTAADATFELGSLTPGKVPLENCDFLGRFPPDEDMVIEYSGNPTISFGLAEFPLGQSADETLDVLRSAVLGALSELRSSR